MALVAYVLEHTANPGDMEFDGVNAMLLVIDDGVDTSATLIKAHGASILATLTTADVPSTYFDTARKVSDMDNTAGNYVTFGSRYKLNELVVG